MKEMHPLRKYLIRHNKSVKQFADENNINESTIYLWFKGESFPNQENIAKLQDALDYEDPINLYQDFKEWQNEYGKEE